jgi:acyl dehydratase
VARGVKLSGMASQAFPRTTALGTDFSAPIDDRYFEDYTSGAVYEYGYVTVDEAEIIEFAERYDPQPIHIDPEYAATGPFGGLIASGWHSAGIYMRMLVDHFLSQVASLASPGLDELRWPSPLRPGDTVRMRATILETRVSRSKPDRGIIRTKGELITNDDRVVMQLMAASLMRRRETTGT